jgi:hypothetical protein
MSETGDLQVCGNCDHGLHAGDRFCSFCGQDTHPHKIPFKHLIAEFLEGTLHLDTKILPTLKKLLTNPGTIIRDYNHNKRARYVPPIRLYVFVSFVYFFLIAGNFNRSAQKDKSLITTQILNPQIKTLPITLFHTTVVPRSLLIQLMKINRITIVQVDSALHKNKITTDKINTRALYQMIRLLKGEITPEEIRHTFISLTSKMMFLLMPLFALILLIVNGWKKLYYSETLIFSLYFHSFLFILLGLFFVITNFVGNDPRYLSLYALLYSLLSIIILVYLLLSLKAGFTKSWRAAILNSVLTAAAYLFIFGVFFSGVAIISFLL